MVDVEDLLDGLPLSPPVLGEARAALFRAVRVLEDRLVVLGVLLQVLLQSLELGERGDMGMAEELW